MIVPIVDEAKLNTDDAYREDMRHRCVTDHFFLAEIMGFHDFHPVLHAPVADLYFPKNPKLSIPDQHPIKNRMHLDPRGTFKTTWSRVDSLQWILAFPETITILNESATQDLAKAVAKGIADYFCQYKIQTVLHRLFPEMVVNKWPFHAQDTWNTPNHDMRDIDATLAFTSPLSQQSGWHPWIDKCDDMVDTRNSGLHASAESRRKVIDSHHTNKNTIRRGGYLYLPGTRYHPQDLYGETLANMDPAMWKVLIRAAIVTKNGQRLVTGEFPDEDDVVMTFGELPGMDYHTMRDKFYENYESFQCFTAGHRVLMADWTQKNIEDMKIGDEVIGLEKKGRYDSRLVKTKVVNTFVRRAEAVESTTQCGRKMRHTPDHRFLRPSNGGAMRYVKLKVGCKTVSIYKPITPPTAEQQRDLDWLGGLLDGEGTISKSNVLISQKNSKNPEIFEGIEKVLNRIGIPFTMGKTHETDTFLLLGGRSLLIWLLNHARMMKLNRLHDALWSARQHSETTGRGGGPSQPKIIKIEPIGEQMVYDIETETHNFVCEGFAVHNCQQMNDPLGGNVSTFDEKLYASCEMAVERLPAYGGETYTCWRLPCGKKHMENAEGVAARVIDGRVYAIDAFEGNWIPSKLAERMVEAHKKHQADAMLILMTPGSEFMAALVRNEAARRNVSIRIQWVDWEENEELRRQEIKQLEPLMKVGRLVFSTGMGKAKECRRQFVHFGLVQENGIIECMAKLGNLVPMSQMRASLEDEEIEYQRSRKDDATLNWLLNLQGTPIVDEQAKKRAMAHQQAMQESTTYRLPPMPGGLDG